MRTKALLPSIVGTGILNAGVAFAVDSNVATAVSVLVATVGLTMAVVSWIDKRIDAKIAAATAAWREHDAGEREERALLRREIHEFRHLLSRGVEEG